MRYITGLKHGALTFQNPASHQKYPTDRETVLRDVRNAALQVQSKRIKCDDLIFTLDL